MLTENERLEKTNLVQQICRDYNVESVNDSLFHYGLEDPDRNIRRYQELRTKELLNS